MVDSCPSYGTEEEVFQMLMHNFKRHYNTNRAPFGLYFHTIWFKKRINLRAFQVAIIKYVDVLRDSLTVHLFSGSSRKWFACLKFG